MLFLVRRFFCHLIAKRENVSLVVMRKFPMRQRYQSTMYKNVQKFVRSITKIVWKPIVFLYARNVQTACCSMTAKKCVIMSQRKDRWIHWVNGKWQQHQRQYGAYSFLYTCISCASVMKFRWKWDKNMPVQWMAMVLPPHSAYWVCVCVCVPFPWWWSILNFHRYCQNQCTNF